MILKGSQRGGAKQLALHLLNAQDNETVELHSLQGFVADDLEGGLAEIHAVSRATRCKQFLFSLSLSPPKGEDVSVAAYEEAVEAAARRLGLGHQPRAVVFHEKDGRRHCHAVFSRIDGEKLTAINLSFFKDKLNGLSHELYMQHGWSLPEGFRHKDLADPLTYGIEEYQTAKRADGNARAIKADLLRCWETSDSAKAFETALAQQGYRLCRGTRRGFVLIDTAGRIYSLSRWLNRKPKELRARLGDPATWPAMKDRRQEPARNIEAVTEKAAGPDKPSPAPAPLDARLRRMEEAHRRERTDLERRLTSAREIESLRGRSALSTLWHRLTGQSDHREQSAKAERERQKLLVRQTQERRALKVRIGRAAEAKTKPSQVRRDHAIAAADTAIMPTADERREHDQRKARIRHDPAHVLDVLTERQATFTRSDIARMLHRYIDDPQEFQSTLLKASSSPRLVEVETRPDSKRPVFSTREMLDLEQHLIRSADRMMAATSHGVDTRHIRAAQAEQNRELQETAGGSAGLSTEQRRAIAHVCGPAQLSMVVGLAGAGKSTMLAGARRAFEKQGYCVVGGALAGKAAEGLQQASGIPSRTLASYDLSWKNGLYELGTRVWTQSQPKLVHYC